MRAGCVCRAGETLFAARRTERWWERLRGLLGTRGAPRAALYIAPCNAVHTFGMRCALDVAFLDRQGRVLRTVEALPPWRYAGAAGACAALECAAGTLRACGISAGDCLVWRPAT